MIQNTDIRAPHAPSARTNGTVVAYGLGALVTAGALVYAVVDQLAVGGLDGHLHRLYDPVGKYGEAAPLYGYLYAVGVIGLLCWWANLRRAVRGARGTRRLGVITLVVALLPVAAPLVLQEYGQPVIPVQLIAGYLVAWLLGLVGVVLAGRATTPGA
ncbi:hypothetical protein [Tsukamurella pseudospumae]|uniref:DUF2637 domain-containing protein n=1 Tax=Tsukamurella pseudospumae TaxID=239498 RepID=A0A137ZHL5_9ACTN|nr:hypothetical protein [Tsukamurella pseudospumae]KXO97676.1 hypothetical protein AXK61_21805 [Tsukamurella pseudospumae]